MSRLLLFFALIVVSFGGCSFVNSTIKPELKQVVTNMDVSSAVPIYLGKFVEQTGQKCQGIKKSELGIVTANVYTDPQGQELIRNALARELQQVGFVVKHGKSGKNIQIDATILEYFVEPEVRLLFARVCAVVTVDIIVSFPTDKKYRRKFKGISNIYTPLFWHSSIPIAGDSVYQTAVELALQDFLKKSVPALCQIIENKGIFSATQIGKEPK